MTKPHLILGKPYEGMVYNIKENKFRKVKNNLKTCPFCGCHPNKEGDFRRCSNSECNMMHHPIHKSTWNMRIK